MKFREYLRYNSNVIIHSLKLTGVIFTMLILIFVLPTKAFANSQLRLPLIFIISVFCGNFVSFLICCLKLNSTFQKTRRNYKLFNTISLEVIEKYKLKVKPKTDVKENKFLEVQIVGKIDQTTFLMELSENKEVWITIINKLDNILNFPKRRIDVDIKYRKQKITLTGWGLRRLINIKIWNKLNEEEIDKEIRQLFKISDDENIQY